MTANFPTSRSSAGGSPARRYRVRPPAGMPEPAMLQLTEPGWLASGDGVTLTGSVLGGVGLQLPAPHPEQALLLELTAVA
jgi:alpha-galactosidase